MNCAIVSGWLEAVVVGLDLVVFPMHARFSHGAINISNVIQVSQPITKTTVCRPTTMSCTTNHRGNGWQAHTILVSCLNKWATVCITTMLCLVRRYDKKTKTITVIGTHESTTLERLFAHLSWACMNVFFATLFYLRSLVVISWRLGTFWPGSMLFRRFMQQAPGFTERKPRGRFAVACWSFTWHQPDKMLRLGLSSCFFNGCFDWISLNSILLCVTLVRTVMRVGCLALNNAFVMTSSLPAFGWTLTVGKWIAEIHQGLKHLHRGMTWHDKPRRLVLGTWGMTTGTIYINSSTGEVIHFCPVVQIYRNASIQFKC